MTDFIADLNPLYPPFGDVAIYNEDFQALKGAVQATLPNAGAFARVLPILAESSDGAAYTVDLGIGYGGAGVDIVTNGTFDNQDGWLSVYDSSKIKIEGGVCYRDVYGGSDAGYWFYQPVPIQYGGTYTLSIDATGTSAVTNGLLQIDLGDDSWSVYPGNGLTNYTGITLSPTGPNAYLEGIVPAFPEVDPQAIYLYMYTNSGTAGTLTIDNLTITYTPPALEAGAFLRFTPEITNTGAVTLEIVDGGGAIDLLGKTGGALAAGDLQAGKYYSAVYDGSDWVLVDRGGVRSVRSISYSMNAQDVAQEAGTEVVVGLSRQCDVNGTTLDVELDWSANAYQVLEIESAICSGGVDITFVDPAGPATMTLLLKLSSCYKPTETGQDCSITWPANALFAVRADLPGYASFTTTSQGWQKFEVIYDGTNYYLERF